MRRKSSRNNGFLISYILNLIFNAEWLLFSLISFGLAKWLNIPDFFWKLFLGIWLGWTLIVTLTLCGLISAGNSVPQNSQPNKNPYSAKNIDYSKSNNPSENDDELHS